MNKRFWLPVLGLMITTLANAQRPSTYESGEKEKAEAAFKISRTLTFDARMKEFMRFFSSIK